MVTILALWGVIKGINIAAWVASKWAIISGLFTGIGTIVSTIAGWVGTVLAAIGAIVGLPAWAVGLIIAAIVAIVVVIVKYWDEICDFFKKAWNSTKDFFARMWEYIKKWWQDNIAVYFTKHYWASLWDNIKKSFTEKMTEIREWFSEHVLKFFTKEYWVSLCKKIKEGLSSGFKGAFNAVIEIVESAINKIISKLNTLSWEVPDWVPGIGGETFGFNFPKVSIPRLAQGAVIPPNREFMAVLGDQKHGTNIETPLDTMIEAFTTALNGMQSSTANTPINFNMDGKTFARAMAKLNAGETRRVGMKFVN